jgi:ArsR family transcriptional regulator
MMDSRTDRLSARESSPAVPGDPTAPGPADLLVTAAKALSDRFRVNVLRVLREDSYGVLELCSILSVAQPAMSHHLKVLHDAGLTARRREGNSIFYRRAPATTELRRAMLAAVDTLELPPEQIVQIERIHAARNRRSRAFFAEHAADFALQQARIADAAVYIPSVLELVDRELTLQGPEQADLAALEIGPGDGEVLRELAPRFASVIAIDNEPAMLERCAGIANELPNVRLLHRDFTTLPSIARYRLVVAAMVLHHLASPARVFVHARRLVSPGGLFAVVEICRHDHEWVREACGDLWLGFEPQELLEWAGRAGFVRTESHFLAQKNGFQIQIHGFRNSPT